MFQKLLGLFVVFLCLFFICPSKMFAQQFQLQQQAYEKAKVIAIPQEGKVITDGQTMPFQQLTLQVQDGKESGKVIHLTYGDQQTLTQNQMVHVGQTVVLLRTADANGKVSYVVYDSYRLPNVMIVVLLFVLLVFAIALWKGLGSLIGVLTSLAIILFFMVPQILHGANPLGISLIGGIAIILITTYIAHGISRQTTVALGATILALFVTVGCAMWFVQMSYLAGLGSEDIANLQVGATSIINLQGLLLGGIIIGTLGALNDVTITQSAAIFALSEADHDASFFQLVKRGFSIGREHILSLVNTLVLAYAGSSLFIFIYLILNPQHVPYWVILNSETLSDEIVSTVAGSIGLMLAVPLVTLFASWGALYWKKAQKN